MRSPPFNVRFTNDYYPAFKEESLNDISCYENATVSSVVHRIIATDADRGEAGNITYTLKDVTNTFNISSVSGDIKLLKPLDRENIQTYTVTITATDGAPSPFYLMTSREVNIIVRDINDNAPTFGHIPSPILIRETVKINEVAYTINVTDLDVGTNGEVELSVLSTNDSFGYFELARSNGSFIARSKFLYTDCNHYSSKNTLQRTKVM